MKDSRQARLIVRVFQIKVMRWPRPLGCQLTSQCGFTHLAWPQQRHHRKLLEAECYLLEMLVTVNHQNMTP